ncbi:B3 domain-containing transcription factor VAL3-like [Jatropha curcas]|uniref:B3 domain-containing transcription factor VAL3-like n=1 Tax=Jatropha curcas TaxID=180498 RepID=UPI001895162E|nr:B3 domain-containing transcription factor VAL3-like [Jatropha curcas]
MASSSSCSSGSFSSSGSSSSSSGSSGMVLPFLTLDDGKCFYCKSFAVHFRRGWQLQTGNYSGLCEACACAYESGCFCNIFHWDAQGWRKCTGCRKLLHCGCVMSTHTHVLTDFGGIKCMQCLKKESGN